jgi:hypothetical protein
MTEFRQKMTQEGKATRPMLFIYSKEMYMSRYISDFKAVLKNYNGMFDVFYTGDPEEAKKYFYIGEFPEVIPVVILIDPTDRKAIRMDLSLEEKAEGSTSKETSKEAMWENTYPKKYRELVFMNSI